MAPRGRTNKRVSHFSDSLYYGIQGGSAGPPGPTGPTGPTGATGATGATGPAGASLTGLYVAYDNGIRVANSASTNTTNLNNLISTLAGVGGGYIIFAQAGAIPFNSTINLATGVCIDMIDSAILTWSGSTSGTCVSSSASSVLCGTKLQMNVNEGSSFTGTVFSMHSAIGNQLRFVGFGSHSSGGVFCSFFADSSSGLSIYPGLFANRNFAANEIHIRHHGTCGYGLLMAGITSGYAGAAQGATDNTFQATTFFNILNRGIKINEWSDSNTFTGKTYIGCSSAANSIGIIVNEGRTNNNTVYNTHFEHLSIDTFGTGLNRTGVVLQESETITCDMYFNEPEAENGAIIGTNCTSYQFRWQDPATNKLVSREKGIGTPIP